MSELWRNILRTSENKMQWMNTLIPFSENLYDITVKWDDKTSEAELNIVLNMSYTYV